MPPDAPHSPSRAEALRLLAVLDVPECDCPFVWQSEVLVEDGSGALVWIADVEDPRLRPAVHGRRRHLLSCPHVQATRDHGLSVVEWIDLLELTAPDDYRERPTPPPAPQVLGRAARVEVYRKRQAKGVGLRRPDDLWVVGPVLDALRAGPEAQHHPRSGADVEGPLRTAGEAERE